jgi:cytochrome c oxidase assembly protein subunit 11
LSTDTTNKDQQAVNNRRANRKLVWQLSLFALGSLAFGFALVPLYNVLCEVTGYGNRQDLLRAAEVTPTSAAANAINRELTIEFFATNPTVGEWTLKPVTNSIKVQVGQLAEIKFLVSNLLSKPVTGQAIPSLAPHQATQYFRKTECFCFTPQHFDALQTREFTVRFVVDSQLPANVDRLSLSYAMYGVDKVASR